MVVYGLVMGIAADPVVVVSQAVDGFLGWHKCHRHRGSDKREHSKKGNRGRGAEESSSPEYGAHAAESSFDASIFAEGDQSSKRKADRPTDIDRNLHGTPEWCWLFRGP